MSKRTWDEIICDGCGSASHYAHGDMSRQAREDKWIFRKNNLHFCGPECMKKYNIKINIDNKK